MPWDIIAIPALVALIYGFISGKNMKDKLVAKQEQTKRHEK